MDTAKCWERVRGSLPPCDVEEIEQARPKTLAEYVSLAEGVRDRERLNAHAWTLWRDALSEWAREQEDAREVLRALTLLDHRLGVWCACQVAKTVVHHVPETESWPRFAIENAERWVCSAPSARDPELCEVAALATWEYRNKTPANSLARHAAEAAYAAAYAAAVSPSSNYYTDSCAYAAALAAAAEQWHWREALDRQLRELCIVVADAINTMPWEV